MLLIPEEMELPRRQSRKPATKLFRGPARRLDPPVAEQALGVSGDLLMLTGMALESHWRSVTQGPLWSLVLSVAGPLWLRFSWTMTHRLWGLFALTLRQ